MQTVIDELLPEQAAGLQLSEDEIYQNDDPEGVAEAMRRLEAADKDPSLWMSEEEFMAAMKAMREA